MQWAEFNETLERKLQENEENRFPCRDALVIISFMFAFVGFFSLGWEVKIISYLINTQFLSFSIWNRWKSKREGLSCV